MPKPLMLAVDPSVLYSVLLFNGPERRVFGSSGYLFCTCDFNVWELSEALCRNGRFSRAEAARLVGDLPLLVLPLPFYEGNLLQADGIIGWRDKRDVPLLALALSIRCDGIWSSDRDFEVVKCVRIWRTSELAGLER